MNKAPIERILRRLDGRGYKAYKELLGASQEVDGLTLRIVRVQGDPFAPPSVVKAETRIEAPRSALGEPVALADWIHRRLYGALRSVSGKLGEGRSGYLGVPRPGPIMIRRSAVEIRGHRVTLRVWAGLPSRRRRIDSTAAYELLLKRLPKAIKSALKIEADIGGLMEHIYTWRLQEKLRSQLRSRRLVAFVGDGSILPRRCGGCEDPLPDAVPFESPPSLRVELEGPEGEPVSGMGVRRGLTVIAGSAFHGKTTLAESIVSGVWNHVPGDGREKVVSLRSTMYVRAEDGRFVSCVDVSPLIHDLPGGQDTRCFTTEDASGATSTAAAIQEAVEAGAELLVLDEDTSATNILYDDERTRGLTEWHTVTPLARVAAAMRDQGVSLVIVSSGSMPLLAVADTVIVMEGYRARDATEEARRLASEYGVNPAPASYRRPVDRRIISVPRMEKPKLRGGRIEDKALEAPVDLNLNPHLEEESQYNTVLVVVRLLHRMIGKTIPEVVALIEERLREGFEKLVGGDPGPGLGEIRGLDAAYAINRIPGIRLAEVT